MRPALSILVPATVLLACFLSVHVVASQSPEGQPSLDEPRVWTDVSGRFSRTGVLVEVRTDEVRLRQPSGRHSTIAWDKLSAADQEFARDFVERTNRPADSDPGIAGARTWTDATGRLQSTATLVAVHGDVLVLQKPGGKRVTARLENLSRQDQEFVRAFAGPLTLAAHVAQHDEGRQRAPQAIETSAARADVRAAGGVQPPARAQLTASSPFPLLPAWASPSAPAKIIHLQVSRRFLDRFVPHDVNTSDAVNDVIVGTPVSGASTTHGQGSIVLVPSGQQAIADIFFAGSSQANTVSDGGRAQVFSYSSTDFQARKRIVLDSGGLHSLPTTSSACTNAQTCGICSSLPGLRGAIARRITGRRTDDSRWQANQESASHFEQALNRHLDNDVTSALAEIMRVDRQFFAATKQGGLKLRRQCSSTADRIDISISRNPSDQTSSDAAASNSAGADALPPAIPGDPPAALWIHNSFVQQVLGDAELRAALAPLTDGFLNPDPAAGHDGATASPSDWKVGWTQDGSWLTLSFGLPPQHSASRQSRRPVGTVTLQPAAVQSAIP